MSKKQKQGHFCKICQTYKANEKFSGKGHRQHICKVCHQELQLKKRERKRANQKAIEAGLRPINKEYPKTARQAASYLQIGVATFEASCEQLGLEPCEINQDWEGTVPLYDIEAMIAVYQVIETQTTSE